jgi:hypothetical protein
VTKTFTYADAVRLLGGDAVTGVEWMDRIARGTLRGLTMGMSDVLSCFGVRTELVRVGRDLVRNVTDRRTGLGRFDRTQRIQAAHSIIVITAYFEALHEAELPFNLDQLELTKAEQVTLIVDHSTQGGAGALVGELLDTAIPLPTPQRPREDTVRELRALYESLSARLVHFAAGLAAWERQVGADRRQFVQAVRAVPVAACERYELLLRDLAVAFPEVANWANLQDHQATRHQIRELRTALVGLERLLGDISGGAVPNERLIALTRAYRADLDRPIVEPGDVPEGMQIPTLGEAYVDPRFRVADVPTGSTPSEESWWSDVPVRDDMNGFLAGYLTSPQATQAPLLVLGQPGSGKSVLTRVLATRLPPSDFLVVRVVLREIPADMDLQDQVEQSMRRTTGERLEWPALVRSAGNALPVVLLDGFDEMLQATGVSQTDYLVKVRAFQQREAAQGRPVAAVITSRITVANRARIPDDTVAVRLESFSMTQVTEWLDMWRDANERYFHERDMTALPAQTALIYPDLAEQPLLLLMLALYDADNNLLQGSTVEFSRADLYDRLLARFARREVSKSDRYSGAGLDEAVEEELHRLSIVAFAMFNRASQFVTEADLDRDLTTLLGTSSGEAQGFRAPLGAAELVLGQFFFVQESQAFRGDRRLHTYEFLHATFGEFLVARLIWQVLEDVVARDSASWRSALGANRQDDGMLFALLSFASLSSSPSVIGFLAEIAGRASDSNRSSLAALLSRLCTLAQVGRSDQSHVDYEPRRLPAPTRHSIYTANLVILVVIVKGEARVTELFDVGDPVTAWYQHALLWRSQMSNSEYVNLVDTLVVSSVIREDRTLDVRLHLDDGTHVPPDVDLYETYLDRVVNLRGDPAIFVAADQHPDVLRRRALFTMAKSDAVFQHVLEPLVAVLKDTMNVFVRWPDDMMQSAAYLLMQAVLLPLGAARAADDEAMAKVYRRCAQVAMLDRLPWSAVVRDRYCALLLDRLRTDGRVAVTVVDEVLSLLLPRREVRIQLVSCAVAVLGRDPGCDRALLAKLQALVDAEWAAQEPAVALEAWLRVVEVGLLDAVEGFLATAPGLFEVLDPSAVRVARPELMTRMRWAVADQGYELPDLWARNLG